MSQNHHTSGPGGPGLLLINPRAGGAAQATWMERVREQWKTAGDYQVIEIPQDRDIQDFAKELTEQQPGWIAVAGGDGTVESVATALIGTRVPLLVLPVGTYNNFARSLGIPTDPVEAASLLTSGQPEWIDAGEVNGRHFYESVGVGIDAALYPESEAIKQGNIMRWFRLLKKAKQFKPAPVWVTLDRPVEEAFSDQTEPALRRMLREGASQPGEHGFRAKMLMMTVSNGPLFGANFAVAPQQSLTDGLLTLSLFSHFSKPQLWWHFWTISFGRYRYQPKTIVMRAAEIDINAPDPWPVHLDGDPLEAWPLKLRCQGGALQVFR